MWKKNKNGVLVGVVVLLLAAASSSASFIADGDDDAVSTSSSSSSVSSSSSRRHLLQAKKACGVNFEFLNYSIITTRCKGPSYPPTSCCSAFKDLACPFSDVLNDLTNDCASTLFSYINIYGSYPPGLFSSECREGEKGLACPALSPSQSEGASGGTHLPAPLSGIITTTGIILIFRILFE